MEVLNQPALESAKSIQTMDRFLRALVAMSEKTHIEIGVTLTVNGLIVTGFIIDQATYFQHLIEGIRKTQADAEIKDLLTDFMDQVNLSLQKSSDEDTLHLPKYIHLRDVKIYPSEGRGMPTYGETIWRGHLSSIDGFSLGEMIPAKFDSITETRRL